MKYDIIRLMSAELWNFKNVAHGKLEMPGAACRDFSAYTDRTAPARRRSSTRCILQSSFSPDMRCRPMRGTISQKMRRRPCARFPFISDRRTQALPYPMNLRCAGHLTALMSPVNGSPGESFRTESFLRRSGLWIMTRMRKGAFCRLLERDYRLLAGGGGRACGGEKALYPKCILFPVFGGGGADFFRQLWKGGGRRHSALWHSFCAVLLCGAGTFCHKLRPFGNHRARSGAAACSSL